MFFAIIYVLQTLQEFDEMLIGPRRQAQSGAPPGRSGRPGAAAAHFNPSFGYRDARPPPSYSAYNAPGTGTDNTLISSLTSALSDAQVSIFRGG